jgi:hypothetical protein
MGIGNLLVEKNVCHVLNIAYVPVVKPQKLKQAIGEYRGVKKY